MFIFFSMHSQFSTAFGGSTVEPVVPQDFLYYFHRYTYVNTLRKIEEVQFVRSCKKPSSSL
ncbi:hypothetical protein NC652_029289 [Populus alba x Populus x berolinensis]|nr:hypothetical protein NC652_029289 [Populus alba x Populus x berolinensis]